MVRPLLPKKEDDDSSSVTTPGNDPQANKRKCISSACIPCRKRKSKCDGGLPSCSTCTAVYNTECEYNIDSDYRRKGALKKDIESLRERNGALGIIVASIRSGTDAEVRAIVQQIRSLENLETLAESLKKNMTLPAQLESQSLEGDLAQFMARSRSSGVNSGQTRQYGHTSSLGLVPHDDETSTRPAIPTESWTTITHDTELVNHLLDLYFAWQHPFYNLLSKECFFHDMKNVRTKYCSPLLVNALLASACSFSDRPEALANRLDNSTAGDHFFTEAVRLLNRDSRSSLTTVQALAVLSIREACYGRDSSGYRFAGRCIHMALELGLHLSPSKTSVSGLTPAEIEARKVTFWGAFMLDNAWAICVGRISQLPRSAISVEKPSVNEAIDTMAWGITTGAGIPAVGYPSREQSLLQYSSSLAEVVNDMVFMFYAPTGRFTSKRLLEFYSRYQRWEKSLPQYLQATQSALPHVLCLHMYYHTVVLHLFRPFLKVDLLNSSVSPRDVCVRSAERVSNLASTYRRIYSLRCTSQIICHCVLSSSTIHLLTLPSTAASQHLVEVARNLAAMSRNHAFASRCLRIIQSLAQKWGVTLPAEVTQAAADAVAATHSTSISPTSINFLFPVSDTQPTAPALTDSAGGAYASSSTDSSYFQNSMVDGMSKPSSPRPELFWTPFPDHGVPLQPTPQSRPMDIAAMLDVPSDVWEQISRDGFKLADLQDPMLGRIGFEGDTMQTL